MDNALKPLLRTYLLIPAATLAYALTLHWVYTALVVPQFAYQGFRYVPAGLDVHFIVWIATSVVACFLPRTARRPSDVVLWILFVVVIAPSILMLPNLGPMSTWEGVGISLSLGAAFLITVLVARRTKPVTPLPLSLSPTSFWVAVTAFSLFVYVYIAFTAGLSFQFVSILDVYDVRADYRESLAGASLLGYLVSTQANVINPLIIAKGIQSRRWLLVAVGVFGQLVLFSGTGFKTILFSFPAILIITWVLRGSAKPRMLTLLWGACALLLTTAVADFLTGGILWTSLFGRRFLFAPAWLTGLYFEWYSNNPLSLMGNSILAPFVHTDYQYSPANTIALYATGSPTASLNANLFAASFAEFGWVGLFGVAVLLGVYLRILDRASHNLPVWFSAVVVVMPSITLANTALHTAMLSHGLAVAVIALAIVPRGIWEKKAKRQIPGLESPRAVTTRN